jgi:hypothetical protein
MMQGRAAIAMWCDIAPEARAELEDWHTHEHMPERLAIPGFRRGSRWVTADGGDGYFILYEAEALASITSGTYLERLNHPTPWSRKMMPHHRNMVRSLCEVRSTHGSGLACAMLTLRCSPQPGAEERLARWLSEELLPGLPARRGLAAAHLLAEARPPDMAPTAEQKLRGNDASADWVVLVNGYRLDALAALARGELGEAALAGHGARAGAIAGIYALGHSLVAGKA